MTREQVLAVLRQFIDPASGRDLVAADLVRALDVDAAGNVRFVVEAASPAQAAALEPVRAAAVAALERLPGIGRVSALTTAHSAPKPPPSLTIGRHPTPQAPGQTGPQPIPGIRNIIAVASGKGGVGKSTVASNLAVALALEGRRTGLLDADIHGPSQPRMMGVSQRPASPDGKTIIPLVAHGVTMISIGLMLKEDEAVIWRGPMLMGALQQLLGQVAWGELDVLVIDLPPGTGDVQLSLAQKTRVTGAIIVSTPQDVALIDARKAMAMFDRLDLPILGLIENMSTHVCSNCGHEEHIFGHGGARDEAARRGLPFLGEIPLDIDIRLSGDSGTPIVARDPAGARARAYRDIARMLVSGGKA
jgi:ATP-binding protein involved in chromosome partitioning